MNLIPINIRELNAACFIFGVFLGTKKKRIGDSYLLANELG